MVVQAAANTSTVTNWSPMARWLVHLSSRKKAMARSTSRVAPCCVAEAATRAKACGSCEAWVQGECRGHSAGRARGRGQREGESSHVSKRARKVEKGGEATCEALK
eukprot:3280075-Pleurochrysis_carterae.AAC.2